MRLWVAQDIRLIFCHNCLKRAELPLLIREVRRVGYNIDQILKRANAIGLLDVPQLRKALEDNRAVEKLIVNTYTTPSD